MSRDEQCYNYKIFYYARWYWSELGSYGIQRVRAKNPKEARQVLRKLLDSRVVIEEIRCIKVRSEVQEEVKT